MLRTPNAPMTRNNRIVAMFLFFIIVTLVMNVLVALSGNNFKMMIITGLLWINDLIMFTVIWRSESSFIERDTDVSFVSLMETFDAESLCPFCRVIRLPQSRHCNICNRCVERYDHHCPWVNNCVGRTNHLYFYIHLILVLLYCICSMINALLTLFKAEDGVSTTNQVPEIIITASTFTLITLAVLFGVLITILIVYQT